MADLLLDVQGLTKSYRVRGWRSGAAPVVRPALLDVSLSLGRGETLGIVGESGSGKSTLAKCLVLLERPDRGHIRLNGVDITSLRGEGLRQARRRIQIVFQDPYSSLNPRMTVGDTLSEVLRVHQLVSRRDLFSRVRTLLDLVGLPAAAIERYPSSFSGGQRQRICLARALAAEPDVLIADEPVSALDVSIQAQILNLLVDLRNELGLAVVFISHNMFVVQYLAPRIAVMFGGRIVEYLGSGSSLEQALHPYTQALLASAPTLGREVHEASDQSAPAMVYAALPIEGCPYRDRCAHAFAPCSEVDPPALPVAGQDHRVACHHVAGASNDGEGAGLSIGSET